MAPVFGHGRLRLYLLGLLGEAPRHGYEVIRLLEERFHGMYAPSAGTVYPRLAKLEKEGLVSHTTEGGRKVYALTDAGRQELDRRRDELAELEREIHESVLGLAVEIREDVRTSAHELREEIRAAKAEAARGSGPRAEEAPGADETEAGRWSGPSWNDRDSWRAAKEEWQRTKEEIKQQARRAKEESRQARREAAAAHEHAQRTQAHTDAELRRFQQRFHEQFQEHLHRADWPAMVLDGINDLTRELAALVDPGARPKPSGRPGPGAPSTPPPTPPAGKPAPPAGQAPPAWTAPEPDTAPTDPDRAGSPDADVTADPLRTLERLLDRFRDDVRDAARDRGLTADQLAQVRRRLSETAAWVTATLGNRGPRS